MRWLVVACAILVAGCAAQGELGAVRWYDHARRIAPQAGKVWVCHGFGCHYKTPVTFSRRDIAAMRKIMGRPSSAAAERARIRRLVAWAERRVAAEAGSANDVAGLDLGNARVRGQMDCLDEATNTTSYLLVAQERGLLRFHRVARPVARGYFLDGRYPHATAVVKADGAAYAVDSWPVSNGAAPLIMPLDEWFKQAPRRIRT